VRIALGALALSLLVTGCGAAPYRGPSLRTTCGSLEPELRARWLTTSDGVRLYGATAGSGSTVVVLAPESGGFGLCGWLPTMKLLADRGFRVLAFDFRGVYPSALPPPRATYRFDLDLRAAVDAAGGKHTFLVGASMGAAAVVAYASQFAGIDGVVSLSGEQRLPTSHIDAIDAAPKLRVPLLVLASRLDGYLDAQAARQLVRRAGSSDKQLVLYPGVAHGWDILEQHPAASRVLLGWLRQRRP
jgi:pimeloyl-ACP methyl ester carboxylesterase